MYIHFSFAFLFNDKKHWLTMLLLMCLLNPEQAPPTRHICYTQNMVKLIFIIVIICVFFLSLFYYLNDYWTKLKHQFGHSLQSISHISLSNCRTIFLFHLIYWLFIYMHNNSFLVSKLTDTIAMQEKFII